MGDVAANLFWWALYALPFVVVIGIPVLIVTSRRRKKSADQLELERLRAQAAGESERAADPASGRA